MQKPTAHYVTHVLINFRFVRKITFPASDAILSRKGEERGGHLVSRQHSYSPSCVIPRHVVTHVIINLNDSITLRSERMNPLLVAPAVLSGNEILKLNVREQRRVKRSICHCYLFHSLHNGQIAVAFLDNIHRHVQIRVINLEEIRHPVIRAMRRVGTHVCVHIHKEGCKKGIEGIRSHLRSHALLPKLASK